MDKTFDFAFSQDKRGANHVLLSNYKAIAQEIDNFKVYDDDVWIVTHPKSGRSGPQR